MRCVGAGIPPASRISSTENKRMRSRDLHNAMWAQALDMLERADRLHRRFFQPRAETDAGPGAPRPGATIWEPPIDVIEAGNEYWILVALPGVDPARVRVHFDGATLVVAGERPLPARCQVGAIRRLEIPYGRFERRIAIPWGDFELRDERIENGCLLIGLRRLS